MTKYVSNYYLDEDSTTCRVAYSWDRCETVASYTLTFSEEALFWMSQAQDAIQPIVSNSRQLDEQTRAEIVAGAEQVLRMLERHLPQEVRYAFTDAVASGPDSYDTIYDWCDRVFIAQP
jgi:hypothetical protein